MSAPQEWDKEDVYDEEIAPLMNEIIAICKRENIPMLASFDYKRDEEGPSRCTTHLHGPEGVFDEDFSKCAEIILHSNAFVAAFTVTTREASK